jgi:hypothetical protein
VAGLFWDRNLPPIIRRVPPTQAPGMLREMLRQFAGLKAATICDAQGTAFFNAAGQHLFMVSVRAGEAHHDK